MLENLFGSKARVKILKLFLFNPEQRYYIRQVARDLDLQVNSVRRELDNLENLGLLNSELSKELFVPKGEEPRKSKKQERKYYQVNKKFVLFEEIQTLLLKAQILYKENFEKKLKDLGKPKLIILTGLFVNKPDMEIDIFIVGQVQKKRLTDTISKFEKEIGREINYTLMSNSEFKYRKDITDIFLYSILEDNKKIIVLDDLGVSG